MKSLSEQVDAVERELALRRRVYPLWIQDAKMTAEKAQHEIECMEAVLFTVEKAKILKEVGDEMMKGSQS